MCVSVSIVGISIGYILAHVGIQRKLNSLENEYEELRILISEAKLLINKLKRAQNTQSEFENEFNPLFD